ncbi:hypothetical protein BH11PSE3_BH11PSE3_04640 [soil metagenome]
MVQFRTFVDTFLLEEPSKNSAKLAPVPQGTAYVGEPVGAFVKTRIPTISQEEGFVRILGVSKEIKTPEPLATEDYGNFCGLVTYAAREAGADRDYLIAVAYDCTKNLDPKVLGAKGSPMAGPFQFTAEAWQAAMDGAAAKAGFTSEHRLDWLRQPRMAALLARDATQKFKTAFDSLPRFKELYFLQLVGDPALAALRTPDQPCKTAIEGTPAAGSYAAGLKAGNLTVAAALAALQARLEVAYAEALKIIDQQPPENRFMRASAGDAPWMAVAREQLASGVSETPDRRNTEQIAEYFRSFNAAVGTVAGQDVPWCGAFVGYCLTRCGVPSIGSTVGIGAVGADFWLTWGDAAPSPPPVGSIVVFPGKHVGLLAEGSTATTLQVLGGNQSDRVSIAPFARADAQFRWKGTVPLLAKAKPLPGDGLFIDLAPKIMKRLADDFQDLNIVHHAAILGNLGHECGGFKLMEELNPLSDALRGLGWAQWTATRRTLFENWLINHGNLPVDDFEGNYTFLAEELRTTHKAALSALRKTNDIHSGVEAFEAIFEVANAQFKHYESRERYAQIALSLFSSPGPGITD